MKKFKHSFLLLILVCLTVLPLCGCASCNYQGYDGKYPELYTEAVSSILGMKGYYDSSSLMDPKIEILETDDYGRIMFSYRESRMAAICIKQKSDDNYVFFYPDFNFIGATFSHEDTQIDDIFTAESVDELKELNDFNKEFNETKCIKTAVFRKKASPNLSKGIENQLEVLCKEYAKNDGCKGTDSVYRYASFCTYDDYGRMLFYIYGIHRDVNGEGISPNSKMKEYNLAIIFNPDWSYDDTETLFDLQDLNNYQSGLKEFKQLHNWNQPL